MARTRGKGRGRRSWVSRFQEYQSLQSLQMRINQVYGGPGPGIGIGGVTPGPGTSASATVTSASASNPAIPGSGYFEPLGGGTSYPGVGFLTGAGTSGKAKANTAKASTSGSSKNADQNFNGWDWEGEFSEFDYTTRWHMDDSDSDNENLKPNKEDAPVEYEEDEAIGVAETYSDYKPAKLLLGNRHPDPVVETASLASVLPPDVSYKLLIPSTAIAKGSLSALQLESVIYACQQHDHFLESGERAGFLIGDGAGVGKGRMIGGIMYENFLRGRKKAIWVSVSSDLKYDAERDFEDIGAKINVVSLTKIKYGKIEELPQGVIFCTYSSLIGSTSKATKYNTRMKQLVRWCGPDFDGVIAFDECHRAKNLYNPVTRTPTKTGMAVFNLQEYLPKARILYASATGASEPKDMAYMTRLGIWGHNTTFEKFEDFAKAVDKRGIGAMEIVAMDMKLRGVYIARQLSFQGVTFNIIEAPLTEEFTDMYDESVELWVELRDKFTEAAELVAYSPKMIAFMWRIFWSAHQRYFKSLCIASKIPQTIKETQDAIENGKCVVIGLQTTGEARTLETLEECDGELDEFVSTALGTLQSLVQKHFPDEDKAEEVRLASMGKFVRGKPKGKKADSAGPSSSLKRKTGSGPLQSASKRSKGTKKTGFQVYGSSFDEDDGNENAGSDSEEEFDLPGEEDSLAVLDRLGMPKEMLDHARSTAENKAKKAARKQTSSGLPFSSKHRTPRNEGIRLMKEYLLEKIDVFGERLPRNCLDDLINAFGGSEKVAEMTGRKGRVVKGKDENVQYENRATEDIPLEFVNLSEKQCFMDGTKKIAIISEAASSGISLQSDKRAANTLRRVHITLELPWSADRAIQQFGRTHRSNQANAPEYVFIVSSLAGEHRFASIVAKRLESLGALTHGDRRATESRDLSRFHVHTKFGQKALNHVIKAVAGLEGPLVKPKCDAGMDLEDFFEKVRFALSGVGLMEHSGPHVEDTVSMTKFLNRILGLPVKIQNDLFQFFLDTLQYKIMDAKRRGQFDLGIMDLGDSDSGSMQQKAVTTYIREHATGRGKIELQNLVVERGLNWSEAVFKFAELLDPKEGFYLARQERNGHREVVLVSAAKPVEIEGVQVHKRDRTIYNIYRPNLGLQMKRDTWHDIDIKFEKAYPEKVQNIWQEQYQSFKINCYHKYWRGSCKNSIIGEDCDVGLRQRSYFVLSGAVLLVWSLVENVLHRYCGPNSKIQVVRVRHTDQKMVGILIPKYCVDDLKDSLAMESNEVKEVKPILPPEFDM